MNKEHSLRRYLWLELTLVISIITIMIYLSLWQFGKLITRSKQASTKFHLGSLRTAESIYYVDHEGKWSNNLDILVDRYIKFIPYTDIIVHPESRRVYVSTFSETCEKPEHAGKWFYNNSNGEIKVFCTHPDFVGKAISDW